MRRNLRALAEPGLFGLLAERPTGLSVAMHNAGYAALGLPYRFVAFDTIDTAAALQAMRVLGIRGLALTIPHKENALHLVDALDPEAKQTGSINTVVNDGVSLTGYNTDIDGVKEALRESGLTLAGISVLLLGAGGAARGAIVALRAFGVSTIVLSNRSEERGRALAEEVGARFLPWPKLPQSETFALIVNATPIGSHLGSQTAVDELLQTLPLRGVAAVFDMVTKETELLSVARAVGAITIPGSRMLLFQALRQFQLFTGMEAPREAMEQALARTLA